MAKTIHKKVIPYTMKHFIDSKTFHSLVSMLFLVGLIISFTTNLLVLEKSTDSLYDFGSFIASGRLAKAGRDPYSTESPLIFSVDFIKLHYRAIAPNLNPPISVFLFQQIADLPALLMLRVWRIFCFLFFILGLIFLFKRYPPSDHPITHIAWACSLAGLWHTIQLGQMYTLLLLLAIACWLFDIRGRKIAAGIFLGLLISYKPIFLFWALLLLIQGKWKSFITAGVTSISISAIPIFFYGPNIYVQWLTAISKYSRPLMIFPANNSLQGLTARFNNSLIGIVISLLLACIILYLVWEKKPSNVDANSLGIVGALLISPIAWTGYTLFLLPYFFAQKKWSGTSLIAAIIFSVPFFFPLALFQNSAFNFVFFGWFYGWGFLFILWSILSGMFSLRGSADSKEGDN